MKMKVGRRPLEVWEHAKKDGNGFICEHCRVRFSGSGTRIRNHLKGGGDIRRCHSSTFLPNNNDKNKPSKIDILTHRAPKAPPPSNSVPLSPDSGAKQRKGDVDSLLGEVLQLNNLPLKIVEEPSFQNFIATVARFGPRYEPPTSRHLVTGGGCILSHDGRPSPASGSTHSTVDLTGSESESSSSFQTNFPFINDVPSFIVPFIDGHINVESDGNCGYRSVAHFMYSSEENWLDVRIDLLNEMKNRTALYENILQSRDRAQYLIDSLQHDCSGQAPPEKWMNIYDMAWVIATKYNVVCVTLSAKQNLTYLPLLAENGVQAPLGVITLCFLESLKHIIAVRMFEDFPLPKIHPSWKTCQHGSVFGWDKPFLPRLRKWKELSVQEHTIDHVELE